MGFDLIGAGPIELTKVRRIWIVGCISYWNGVFNVIRHTKFWIMSYMIPENAVPVLIKQEGKVAEFSLPITGWNLVKTEAD
jgi:hypothetical protein